MYDLKKAYTFFLGTRIVVFLLVFLLIGLEIIMLNLTSDEGYLNQAALQRTYCEVFAKSAFVLAYRPAAEKTLALSDLQFVLPLFQQEQAVLSTNMNANVHNSVQQAQPDYQMTIIAVEAIIAHPDSEVDPAVVNTLIEHRQSCVTQMNAIVVALQQDTEKRQAQIFYIEVVIEGSIILFFSALLLFPRSSIALNGNN